MVQYTFDQIQNQFLFFFFKQDRKDSSLMQAWALLLTLPSASIPWLWGSTSTSWGCHLPSAPSQTFAELKFLRRCLFSTGKWSRPLFSKAKSFQKSWFFMKIFNQLGNLNTTMFSLNVQWWHSQLRGAYSGWLYSALAHMFIWSECTERQEYARPRILQFAFISFHISSQLPGLLSDCHILFQQDGITMI